MAWNAPEHSNPLRQVRTLEDEVSLRKGLGTGEVKIGVDPMAEFGFLPEVFETFVPEHLGVLMILPRRVLLVGETSEFVGKVRNCFPAH